VNTQATIYFPVLPKSEISEAYHSPFTAKGIENGKTKVAVGSGYYKFNFNYK
jgi:alpha-L-rhamnosidase